LYFYCQVVVILGIRGLRRARFLVTVDEREGMAREEENDLVTVDEREFSLPGKRKKACLHSKKRGLIAGKRIGALLRLMKSHFIAQKAEKSLPKSHRKVLRARNRGKKPSAVTKRGSTCPKPRKKTVGGNEERFYVPETGEKSRLR
jgi:hypothetical protein